MTRALAVAAFLVLLTAACGDSGIVGGGEEPAVTTTAGPDQPVEPDDGDEPIGEPDSVGSIPEPRPPIDGSIEGEVRVTSTDLRIMESYPIQVMLEVTGEKPTPCHEVFWTVDDTGETIEIKMISQIASDQQCAQVLTDFTIAVPLGSWAGESREVSLNGEPAGSFDS